MGCLGLVIVGALALAVPASIAPASLIGAYVVLAVITVLALAGVRWRRARTLRLTGRGADELADAERALTATRAARDRTTIAIVVLAVGYAALVFVIHVASS